MTAGLKEIITLQSQGANSGGGADRQGGAGPSDAKAFVVGGFPVMIPTLSRSAQLSSYCLTPDDGANAWRLEKNGKLLFHAQALPWPKFYSLKTADGTSYEKIARRHGTDGLASTVIQECVRYNSPKTRCRFCAIGASLVSGATIHTKTPEQLAEVAAAAKRLDGIAHVTLTSGTTADPDKGALYLGECAMAVKEATGLPIEVQFEPLRDRHIYVRLKEMGIDDVGLHVESFDQSVRKRMTPGKAGVSLEKYFQAFADAVSVFGRNKVSTYVILGLGEDERLTLEGCERAANIGVYPFVVPLRPLADSYLSTAATPDPDYLARMYKAVGAILDNHGLSSSGATAGCVRCRACSPLQFVEGASLVTIGK